MKNCVLALCFLVSGFLPGLAQDKPKEPSSQTAAKPPAASSPSSAPAKIDLAKGADIRRLLELTGAKALVLQTVGAMEKEIKPLLTQSFPPGEYREKLIDLSFDKFHTKGQP